MALSDLTEEERKVVGECLHATVSGQFFPDREFETLFGLTRAELQKVADQYPNVDEYDEGAGECDDSFLAINNTFVNLLGYPHRCEADWNTWISVSRDEVNRIYNKWRG